MHQVAYETLGQPKVNLVSMGYCKNYIVIIMLYISYSVYMYVLYCWLNIAGSSAF